MTKAELRAQLMNDTISFVMNGGQIETVPAKQIRIKHTAKGRSSANSVVGGSSPSSSQISSIYGKSA